MNAELTFELERLSQTMREYAKESGKDESDVVARMARKLTFALFEGLRKLAPPKGSIRADRLGKPVRVRPAVEQAIIAKYGAVVAADGRTFLEVNSKGKKVGRGGKVMAMSTRVKSKSGSLLNIRALAVERELAVRESGSGFLSRSVPRLRGTDGQVNEVIENMSRLGFVMSELVMHNSPTAELKVAVLRWLGPTGNFQSATDGLQKARQAVVMTEAVKAVTEDTLLYVRRKQRETAEKFFGT